jgi:hypothetical protein
MRSLAAQARVLFMATLLLAMRARASETVRIPEASPDDRPLLDPLIGPVKELPPRPLPGSKPGSGGPDESQIIRDPLPPAVWSGGSMFALGGAAAAWRRFRRKLR